MAKRNAEFEEVGLLKKTKVDELFEVRFLVPSNHASMIIGKAGCNVKMIREKTGTFVSLLSSSPGVAERVMTIKGLSEAIAAAVGEVAVLLVAQKNEREAKTGVGSGEQSPNKVSVKILAHKFLKGSVIGKGGSIVREIVSTTGAFVSISSETLPGSTEVTISLSGEPANIQQAALRVITQLRENPLKPGCSSILYVPGQQMMTGYAIPSYAPPPQQMASGVYNQYSQPMPQMQQYAEAQVTNPYAKSYPEPANYGYNASGAGSQVVSVAPQSWQQQPPQQAASRPMGGVTGMTDRKTEKIVIPTVAAGSVIGKSGSIIRDISRNSLTQISIADPEPQYPEDRIVSITGSYTAIQTAIHMIRERVESYTPQPAR